MSTEFEAGLAFNAAFYREVVEPLVRPWSHSAGLLGWGSDVLGFDTARSTDHGWGPRLQVFVEKPSVAEVASAVDTGLPESFRGWPIRYGWDAHAVRHRVEVTSLGAWLRDQLGVDPRRGMTSVDWLVVPQQLLLGVVRGAVYADPSRQLAAVRDIVAWYPRDVWLWLLACGWRRLDQEEPFVGRTAEVGDGLGSRLLAARLTGDIMRLAFLLERTYAPYWKWFGTAFAQLSCAASLGPPLARAMAEGDYADREAALVEAYEVVARLHNAAAVTREVDPSARWFHRRPFQVLGAHRFVETCLEQVGVATLRDLPLVGSVDQFADSSDVLSNPDRAQRLRHVYSR